MNLDYLPIYSKRLNMLEDESNCTLEKTAAILINNSGLVISEGYNVCQIKDDINMLCSYKFRNTSDGFTITRNNENFIDEGVDCIGRWTQNRYITEKVSESEWLKKHKEETNNISAVNFCIINALKSNNNFKQVEILLTKTPTIEDAKLIYTSGINNVYCILKDLTNQASVDFLESNGIDVIHVGDME